MHQAGVSHIKIGIIEVGKMPGPNPELTQEVVRLRVENRMSHREIAAETGASRSSVSTWLRPYPLTEDELSLRRSTAKRYTPPKKDRGEASKFYLAVNAAELTRQEKAKIAEAAVAFRLVLHGFAVFASPFDGDKADWIVQVPNTRKIHKIQVRWARAGLNGLPYIGLKSTIGHNVQQRYGENDFDFIIAYDLFSDTAFVYSSQEVSSLKATVSINWECAERWDKLKL